MPVLSMFYGILVPMFYRDEDQHHLPHVHVRYQGSQASIAIEDGTVVWPGNIDVAPEALLLRSVPILSGSEALPETPSATTHAHRPPTRQASHRHG